MYDSEGNQLDDLDMEDNHDCISCGLVVDDDFSDLCDDCLKTVSCDRCGIIFDSTDITPMHGGQHYCSDCDVASSYDVSM